LRWTNAKRISCRTLTNWNYLMI